MEERQTEKEKWCTKVQKQRYTWWREAKKKKLPIRHNTPQFDGVEDPKIRGLLPQEVEPLLHGREVVRGGVEEVRRRVRVPVALRRGQNVDDFRIDESDFGQKSAPDRDGEIRGGRSDRVNHSGVERFPEFFGVGERRVQLGEGLVKGVEGYQGLQGFRGEVVPEHGLRVIRLFRGTRPTKNLKKINSMWGPVFWETTRVWIIFGWVEVFVLFACPKSFVTWNYVQAISLSIYNNLYRFVKKI